MLQVTGTVVSDNQKMIGARYMGYVKKIHFTIGDKVKRKDVLFEMESSEFDIMQSQADLALEQAEIMVEVYRTRLDDIDREKKSLKRRGLKGGTDWKELESLADNVQAGLAATRTMVKNANEKVKQMATIMDYLEIKAPNDGIIVQKQIRAGDLIVPGMLAMVLVDLDHLEIEAQVSEMDLAKVQKGKKVRIDIPSMKFRTIAMVKSIVPSANPMTHTFTIRLTFNKRDKKIYPGMYVKIDIPYKE
ncbi:MAG TPA: efflux RND transporter periplasmic adaptor subunit [Campylobacterales bacterium]|nr:efflux RND transporter periplasmic adaptor subunit [Campylobacterales bacterium]HHS92961.1 efflux RND transporter periplasmic adaptor subunit [Campylobacterales bacterium]